MSFFSGIGAASKKGVLIKGSNYLEALSEMNTIVFDKTGTLTKGEFKVTEIHAAVGTQESLLELAALAESYSCLLYTSLTTVWAVPVSSTPWRRYGNWNRNRQWTW